jgi:hypothetical protein
MNRPTLLSAACVLCLCCAGIAQEVQLSATALLQHARQLSDIRAAGAPAFQLRANFTFVGDNLETVQGTYLETWISDSQWRRETIVGSLRRVVVGGPGKHWLVFPDGFPYQAEQLPTLMAGVPPPSIQIAFASVSERALGDFKVECAYSKPAIGDRSFAFCFEKKSGVLLEKVLPEERPRNVVSHSCDYGLFRKFEDHWFPREVACYEDRHKTIYADVVDLSRDSQMDPALFETPKGGIELGDCSGKIIPRLFSVTRSDFRVSIWMN